MPGSRVAKPWKARDTLALGEHIRSHPCLPRRERVNQQVALELCDAGPVSHVALEIFGGHSQLVLLGKMRNGPLKIPDAGEMLLNAKRVVFGQDFL
jgi:hypothetical protein